ncbi:MAG: D-alanyl-D-alanine carboxypeptidase [Proteobacteria bacterium]|nr:D-alanyl-D-alanine carboxypeptidase [Pseudomonadota bacterium]
MAIANAEQRVYPASLTKMMTLYLTFRALQEGWLHLNDSMSVSAYAASASPTKLGLAPGQMVSVDDLIRGCVTESANDAARVLAENLDARFGRNLQQLLRSDIAAQQAEDAADAATDPPSAQDAAERAGDIAEMHALASSITGDGSEYDFARIMTLQARLLGMQDTVYRNASGLPDMEQVTTAPDYAMLAYALVNMPIQYYSYFSVQHFDYNGRDHRNHNLRFLTGYDGADGIKTGYTQSGGFNVVDTARRGDRRLIAIVMGRRSVATREEDVRALLDYAFAQTGTVTAVSSNLNDDVLMVGSTLDFPTLQTTGVRRVTPQLPDLAPADAPMATRAAATQQRRPAPITSTMR